MTIFDPFYTASTYVGNKLKKTGNKMGNLNIEIKAKSNNNSEIRKILQSKSADFKGIDHQIDTYFKTNEGRLKLREANIENKLIFYKRQDKKGPKKSDYIIYCSEPNSSLKQLLTISNGILTIVDKKREIYFIDNVKFQLDTVKDLGTFIEIEATDVNKNKSKEDLLNQCEFYMELFKLSESDLISVSYSDLILEKTKPVYNNASYENP
ncbi:class IV adenylate cyclase [Mesonia oceanica]|uniref:Uncharacterized protein n=1 Tax=Mesonia oceanica TaxID=2687242 RepID=A0AC61Y4C1_9FLAO|nr:class IV adenylate cyclase [Mesonia oceanica]MAQ40970.1 adenylate cyclase [Mesonia sp.]VVU99325.1 hypothetical protein FVB9532_00577 [Mesonia oceanica]|tara:strand:- start:314 stop:940 length:627 start_codon:yes stop_codon:yes gene_type:complete